VNVSDEKKCAKCHLILGQRCCLNNLAALTFLYMKMNESMHIECYIEHVNDIIKEKIISSEGVEDA